MCGRFVSPEVAEAERNFAVHLLHWQEYERSYNVAPTQSVPVVRSADAQREGSLMRWGLVPFFARGIAPRYATINASIERLATGPCWRGPWRRAQRCILPALGFYEWHLAPNRKLPYYITCADQPVFGFAGLWDVSITGDGSEVLSCAVVTMPANELLYDLHNTGANPHRMPAILAREHIEAWLTGSTADARAVLKPYPAEMMLAHPVSERVNSPDNDDVELIERLAAETCEAG